MSDTARRSVETILFDLDGTLVDSARDIATSVNWVLAQEGQATRSQEDIAAYVGDGMKCLLMRAFDTTDEQRLCDIVCAFRAHYRAHCLDTSQLYPGVLAALDDWRKKKLAVVTNKPYDVTMIMLEGLGMTDRFTTILGGESTPHKKPHPEPLLTALQTCHTPPHASVMVGDHLNDILAGRAAGTVTCAVTYGLSTSESLQVAVPDLCIAQLQELRNHII
jgi:phosphoglycolate phosphatase